MQTYLLPLTNLKVSRIAYGCMKIVGSWHGPLTAADRPRALGALEAALAAGINFFDHADIYCSGKCESAFAWLWEEKLARREDVILQSKCGIRFGGDPEPGAPHRYDFSRAHLLSSVDRILGRLRTDYLDLLLLHRPDPLVEPEEVAAAFDEMQRSGRVRHFGVSNHHPGQIELLRRAVRQPLVVNQLELSVLHAPLIDAGVVVNRADPAPVRSEGTLEYCRTQGLLIQAWSPLAQGRWADPQATDPRLVAVREALQEMAPRYGVTPDALMVAWLLRHPAGIQPILGTAHPERIRACAAADGVALRREDWWRLFLAGRGAKLP